MADPPSNGTPDNAEPTVTYTTPEVPRGDLDDYNPGKGLDSVQDLVRDLRVNYLATEVNPITTSTGVKFEVTGPRRHIAQLAGLYGETLPAPVAEPEPAPQPKPAAAATPAPEPEPALAAPITGAMSAKPLHENCWGGFRTSPVHYHDDGPIGTAVNRMGQDRHLDVDGEPLANVLGLMATDVVTGRRTAQQGVDDLKALQARLPEGSNANTYLSWAIRDMDAPPQPVPAVPDSTPEPLRNLVAELNAVPIVRNDPSREMEPLLGLINDFAAGRTSGFRMMDEIRRLRNKRHESLGDCGKFEIDNAVDAAVKALGELPREALMAPTKTTPKKTTKKLAAVPADPAAIATHLRETATESEGSEYLDGLHLDRPTLLAITAELGLSRMDRLSIKELKKRIITQAIGARNKYKGLREGWQQQ